MITDVPCTLMLLDSYQEQSYTEVLFGMLEDKDGHVVGTDSQQYDTLGIGEQIGAASNDSQSP